jgi:hypothetical protein
MSVSRWDGGWELGDGRGATTRDITLQLTPIFHRPSRFSLRCSIRNPSILLTVLPATMLTVRRLFVPMVALAILAQRAAAQGTATTPVRIPSQTYVAVNPLGVVGDIGTVEVESGIAQGVTVGGVGSYIDVDDNRFTTFDFKVRYYPAEVVLRDWSIGGTFGFTRFSNLVDSPTPNEPKERQSLTAPTIGIIVDKNFLMGRGEHFLIGTGVGAKRVLAGAGERDRANVDRAIFTARLVLGYAF